MILLEILAILKQKAFGLGCRLRAIVVVKKIGESLGVENVSEHNWICRLRAIVVVKKIGESLGVENVSEHNWIIHDKKMRK